MPTIFTILFDGRFWVGVLERHDGGRVRAARVVFGAEPSDVELHAWLLAHGSELLERAERAPGVRADRVGQARRINPKRALRLAAREAARPRTSTTAQQAVKAEREARATQAARTASADRRAEREVARARRRERARARRRGH